MYNYLHKDKKEVSFIRNRIQIEQRKREREKCFYAPRPQERENDDDDDAASDDDDGERILGEQSHPPNICNHAGS